MFSLIRLAIHRLWPVEPVVSEQGEDPSSMADLVRLLEADDAGQAFVSARDEFSEDAHVYRRSGIGEA